MMDTTMPMWFQVLSLVLNLLLGGGFFLTLFTFRSYKTKSKGEAAQATAQAEVIEQTANSQEIDNLAKIAQMWREQAEVFELKWKSNEEVISNLAKTVDSLRDEVKRLSNINSKIAKSLDKIDAENYEKIVEQIKQDIHAAS